MQNCTEEWSCNEWGTTPAYHCIKHTHTSTHPRSYLMCQLMCFGFINLLCTVHPLAVLLSPVCVFLFSYFSCWAHVYILPHFAFLLFRYTVSHRVNISAADADADAAAASTQQLHCSRSGLTSWTPRGAKETVSLTIDLLVKHNTVDDDVIS